jgi:ferredoxin
MPISNFAAVILGGGILTGALMASILSLKENRKGAAVRFLGLGFVVALLPLAAGLITRTRPAFAFGVLAVYFAAAFILWLPIDPKRIFEGGDPSRRFDERDTMLSRRELVPETPRFNEYYARRPDKKASDDAFRTRPGLLSPKAACFDPVGFAAAEASFAAVRALHPLVEGRPAAVSAPSDPIANSRFVKNWALKLGAHSVGLAALKDYHFYSWGGRAERYGRAIERRHPFAVVITVKMDPEMVDGAPFAPIVMESARQYLKSGEIAVQIAETIRNLGAQARAHIDANYQVVCPLLARDAGLGEIGRMGLLITPDEGPRVRIAVVTTDLALVPDAPTRDGTVIDFCETCRKCADCCPARAIPSGGRETLNGTRRWRIDSESCFSYWCAVGTDCGVCLRVCPYSHRPNILHRAVRSGIRRSLLFRRLAIKLDDIFYGKRPIRELSRPRSGRMPA